MEILVTRHNKKPLEKRRKLPFLYAMGGYDKVVPLIRPSILKKTNMFGTTRDLLTLGKSQNILRKRNVYSENTYFKDGKLDYSKLELYGKNRSLDAIYYMFLGYNEFNHSKKSYIIFLKEYLEYFLHILIDTSKFINRKYYLSKYYSYPNKDVYLYLPTLLLCPDINKFTIHQSFVSLCPANSICSKEKSKKRLQILFNYNLDFIQKCFSNDKNISNFLNGYTYLIDDLFGSEERKCAFNFLSSYGKTVEIFENSDKIHDEIDEEAYIDLFPNKCLSELFEEAFELTKKEYKNDFNLFK